jgi:hypothetical protein
MKELLTSLKEHDNEVKQVWAYSWINDIIAENTMGMNTGYNHTHAHTHTHTRT